MHPSSLMVDQTLLKVGWHLEGEEIVRMVEATPPLTITADDNGWL